MIFCRSDPLRIYYTSCLLNNWNPPPPPKQVRNPTLYVSRDQTSLEENQTISETIKLSKLGNLAKIVTRGNRNFYSRKPNRIKPKLKYSDIHASRFCFHVFNEQLVSTSYYTVVLVKTNLNQIFGLLNIQKCMYLNRLAIS